MIISALVLAALTVSVLGLAVLLSHQPHEPDDERRSAEDERQDERPAGHWDDRSDDQWIAELRALNEAMPRLRKHRARVAARKHA